MDSLTYKQSQIQILEFSKTFTSQYKNANKNAFQ